MKLDAKTLFSEKSRGFQKLVMTGSNSRRSGVEQPDLSELGMHTGVMNNLLAEKVQVASISGQAICRPPYLALAIKMKCVLSQR